jgi:MFS family permease
MIASATAISLFGDQALYAILPTCYQKLGLAYLQVGILLSANRWIRLLTNHLAERLIHRVNATVLFVAVLVLGAGLTSAYGLYPSFPALLAARIVWGFCWSLINQVGTMTCMDVAPPGSAARTMGLYSGLSRVGSIVGMFGGAWLFDFMGFHNSFVIMGLVMLLAVVPGSVARRGLDAAVSEFRRPRARAPLNHTAGLLICAFVASCVGAGVIESTLGYVLMQRVGRHLSADGVLMGIATLNGLVLASRHVINLLGAPAIGTFVDRIGHRRATFSFFCATAAILAAAAVTSAAVLLLCLVLLFFLGAVAINVVLATEAGRSGSRAFAWYATASDLGAAFGPLFIWRLLAIVPSPWLPFAIAAALCVIGAAASLLRLPQPSTEAETLAK